MILMDGISERTQGKYPELKLRSAVLEKSKKQLKLTFAYPELLPPDAKEEIISAIAEQIPSVFRAETEFIRDYMDCDLLRSMLFKKLQEDFFTFSIRISSEDIRIDETDGAFRIRFEVEKNLGKMLENEGILEKLQNYFQSITNYKITVEKDELYENTDVSDVLKSVEEKGTRAINKQLFQPSRKIELEVVTDLIGKPIEEKPKFIMDILGEETYSVICGMYGSPSEKITKTGLTVFSFQVTDFTGSIRVVMFPKEADLGKLKTLVPSDEIILCGKVVKNDYSKELEFRAFRVGRCKIGDQDAIRAMRRAVPDHYQLIFPEKFVHNEQEMFLSDHKTAEVLRGKEFVVFDFETTGLNYLENSPIELGAVKIRDGEIVETFTTLLHPSDHGKGKAKKGSGEKLIPDDITKMTGIDDSMVKDAPQFSEIIPDFYKFCYGTSLIGHNVSFDAGFLHFYTKESGYIFDMPLIDTIEVAKKFYHLPEFREAAPSAYNLNAVSHALGVVNEDAHRAMYDAVTTAKCFLKMHDESQKLLY